MTIVKVADEIMKKLEAVRRNLESAFPVAELQAAGPTHARGDCSGCSGTCKGSCKGGRDNCLLKM